MSEATATPTLPKNFRYRDGGKMISLVVAKQRRLAYKESGLPTKIYLLQEAKRLAAKNGEPIPKRAKKTYEAGSQSHADVPSPYDLKRRSGYRVIYQVLAENVGTIVPTAELHDEVNTRLAAEAPEWYGARYSDDKPYDVEANAYVMTRAPYNVKIEAMAQRVSQTGEGFVLNIDVTEPRVLKKRGRKPKVVEVVPDATVEADNDNSVEVTDNATVEAEA